MKVDRTIQRNYQIDVLKLLCAFLVLLSHLFFDYMPVDSAGRYFTVKKVGSFGWVSVHIFFIISGFLMVKSVLNKNLTSNTAGKFSISYVTNKFKKFAPEYIVSVLVCVALYRCAYI